MLRDKNSFVKWFVWVWDLERVGDPWKFGGFLTLFVSLAHIVTVNCHIQLFVLSGDCYAIHFNQGFQAVKKFSSQGYFGMIIEAVNIHPES